MDSVFDTYSNLIQRYLNRSISSTDFKTAYLTRFQEETRPLDEPLFLLLDELFGDIDACTNDPELLAEDPNFYLDEKSLESRAQSVLARMHDWRARHLTA